MLCNKCGSEIDDDSKFCSKCGIKVKQKGKKGKRKLIILAIILLCLFIITAFCIAVNVSKDNNNNATPIKLQYDTKYVYENSYITFFEDGTYTRNVEGIITANYTFNNETNEITCKEIQNVDGYEIDLEIFFKYLNVNEIQKESMKILGIVPNGIEFGEIYSTNNTLNEKQEIEADAIQETEGNNNLNDIDREDLLDGFRFYNERGFYEFTEEEYQELQTYSNEKLQKEWDRISKIVETQDKYDTKYREQLNSIFKKIINVELTSCEDNNYIYTPSNRSQPKARVEYVAINEYGISAIYYSVEMTLTIADKIQNRTEETTMKKYYKTTNFDELNNIIKVNSYDTQFTQDEINNAIAIAGKPIFTYHLSGLPYYFYYTENYVLYYLPEENIEWLNEQE